MCLSTKYKPGAMATHIAKLPDELITVYKAVDKDNGSYCPPVYGSRYRRGLNHAKQAQGAFGDRGFYSFKSKKGLLGYWLARSMFRTLVKFQIKKEWIKAIGEEQGAICYISDRIICPSLCDKSAIVKRN